MDARKVYQEYTFSPKDRVRENGHRRHTEFCYLAFQYAPRWMGAVFPDARGRFDLSDSGFEALFIDQVSLVGCFGCPPIQTQVVAAGGFEPLVT